jgi:hypothetical protein
LLLFEDEDDEGSLDGLRKMIQDLFHSDNAKVNATLDAFVLDLYRDKKESDKIQALGGCFALIHLLKKCLDKAIGNIPACDLDKAIDNILACDLDKAIDNILACDQVTTLNELVEVTTLQKTLDVITCLTFGHYESVLGMAAIGGVEAFVKIMKTFPKCKALQDGACGALSLGMLQHW